MPAQQRQTRRKTRSMVFWKDLFLSKDAWAIVECLKNESNQGE